MRQSIESCVTYMRRLLSVELYHFCPNIEHKKTRFFTRATYDLYDSKSCIDQRLINEPDKCIPQKRTSNMSGNYELL